MLKTLIKKNLLETYCRTFRRRSGRGKKGSGVGMTVLLAILMLYIVCVFAALSFSICTSVATAGMGWLYFLLISAIAVLFGTIGSVFSTYFTLYLAKDNDLLLSMPIPVRDVILSRLMSVYVMGLIYSGAVSVPAVGMYFIVIGFSVPALIGGLVLILLISLVVLALSCLLGWVVAKLSQRLKNRSFLTVLIALLFLLLYYVLYFRLMRNMQNLLESILAFGQTVQQKAPLVYLLGSVGEGSWLGMLVWTGIIGAALFLLWLLLKKTFLSIATDTPTPKRAVYREQTARQGSVGMALLRREWYRFSSSANYMLNCGLGLLILAGLSVYLLLKGGELVQKLSSALGVFPGVVAVIMGSVCYVVGGMMDITAPSVSLEGRTVWQLQCLPVTPWQALRAKLALHLSLAALPTALWLACVVTLVPDGLLTKLLLIALSLLSVLWIALLGLALGVRMPNLDWTNEVVPIKQSAAVFITIFAGMGLGVANLGLYLVFGWLLGAAVWLSLGVGLLLIFDLLLWLWLRSRGAKRFSEL